MTTTPKITHTAVGHDSTTPTPVPLRPDEELARLRKALSIADLLDALGWDADDCEKASPEMWATAAAIVGARKPSESTCEVVVELLASRGRARALAVTARAGLGPS